MRRARSSTSREAAKLPLDRAEVDPFVSDLHLLVVPADELQIAVLVAAEPVAGIENDASVRATTETPARGSRIGPIAEADILAFDGELADRAGLDGMAFGIDDLRRDARHRPPATVGAREELGGIKKADALAFGQPIHGEDARLGKRRGELPAQAERCRASGKAHHFDIGEGLVRFHGAAEPRGKRGRQRQHDALRFTDTREHFARHLRRRDEIERQAEASASRP